MAASLKERRLAAGMTRQQLAHRAGCSLAMLQMLEQGYRPARSQVLPRVEGALAELLDGEPTTDPANSNAPADTEALHNSSGTAARHATAA